MRINKSLEARPKKRINLLSFGRKGQHLSEFLLIFLAVAVAFGGMQIYMRRGVSAKFKQVEDQLNKAVTPNKGYTSDLATIPMSWTAKMTNINGQTVYDCGSGSALITATAAKFLSCWAYNWWNRGCRLCLVYSDFCNKLGLCISSGQCNSACRTINIYLNPWPDGSSGWRQLGITINNNSCSGASCSTTSAANVSCCYCPGCGNGPHSRGECGACPASPTW